jgi:hypothetical protein
VRFEIGAPLHGCRVFAHGRLTDGLQISRHAGESIRAFAKNNCFSIRVSVDNARSLGNIISSGGKGTGDFDFRRFAPAIYENVARSFRPRLFSLREGFGLSAGAL